MQEKLVKLHTVGCITVITKMGQATTKLCILLYRLIGELTAIQYNYDAQSGHDKRTLRTQDTCRSN